MSYKEMPRTSVEYFLYIISCILLPYVHDLFKVMFAILFSDIAWIVVLKFKGHTVIAAA